jgi:hypothetical protein
MRRWIAIGTVVLLAAVGCRTEEPSSERILGNEYAEEGNLLALVNGSVMTYRSGEQSFDTSALYAIDSFVESAWVSPPRDLQQRAIVELPVMSRIESFVVTTAGVDSFVAVRRLRVEGSVDGETFEPIAELEVERQALGQRFPVEPREARFIRITMAENHDSPFFSGVNLVEAHGRHLAARNQVAIGGRWRMNLTDASFVQRGQRVEGLVAMNPPMEIIGSIELGLLRFVWSRGPQVGYGVVSVAPEGERSSGIFWFHAPIVPFRGDPWFGEKMEGEAVSFTINRRRLIKAMLDDIRRFPMFELRFGNDHQLISDGAAEDLLPLLHSIVTANPKHRFRLAAITHKVPDAGENQKIARARNDSLQSAWRAIVGEIPRNLSFDARGPVAPRDPARNPLARAISDRVDFEIDVPYVDPANPLEPIELRGFE